MAENPKLKLLREKAMKLPLTPGVYIMKNKDGEIIYIGKAKMQTLPTLCLNSSVFPNSLK